MNDKTFITFNEIETYNIYRKTYVADCYGDSKTEITEPQLIMD